MRISPAWSLPLLALLAACTLPATHDKADPVVILTAPPADWTPLVGRVVAIEAPLVLLDSARMHEQGSLLVGFGGRVPVPTEVVPPGDAARALLAEIDARTLRLDDGSDAPPADPAHPLAAIPDAATLRAGSTFTGVRGVVRQDARGIALVPTHVATTIPAPRPSPPQVAGALHLASINVLNLFNGDGRGGGFPTARGAKSAVEYARQQAKLVAMVQALAPDAAALMEIENDGYGPESALAQFVAAINAAGPIRDYGFVDAGAGPGDNAIRVALIYRTGRLRPHGDPRTLTGGPFEDRSRVPLAQAFAVVGAKPGTPPLRLVAVHLKSKGCGRGADAATGADADRGDGQACFAATRVDSALRLAVWLGQSRRDDERTVLLGDFNSYAQEDPLRLLHDSGWVDAFAQLGETGPAYSFVFDGRAGRLDHALLDADAAAQLRGAAHWHNNADEPEASGAAAGTDTSPYGASDHDPLVIGGDW
jgi:predicted extracellular nuclease